MEIRKQKKKPSKTKKKMNEGQKRKRNTEMTFLNSLKENGRLFVLQTNKRQQEIFLNIRQKRIYDFWEYILNGNRARCQIL